MSLAESSLSRVHEKLALYSDHCDLIEIRLDFLESVGVPSLPRSTATRFIATCRPLREGGRFEGNELDRLNLLVDCARAGFDWIDLELDATLPSALPPPCRLIRSHHVFEHFPDLSRTFSALRERGGDLFKMAVPVTCTAELVRLLQWMETAQDSGPLRVIVGMGAQGQASRFLGGLLGNAWTYVGQQDEPVAPGQFSLDMACDLPGDAPRAILGVMGRPLAHSLSPGLHNWLLRSHEIDYWYLPLELDDLASWFQYLGTTRLPFYGFSVTLPFKSEVVPFLDELESPVSSVNTLIRRGHGWVGSNTDFEGFLAPLRRRINLAGATAVVLGNGGVAHTVVRALQDEGAGVQVLGRNRERVAAFAASHGCPWDLISDRPLIADLVVNTTPVGQSPAAGDCLLEKHQLQCRLVYDLIYNPPVTRLLRLADEMGCQTVSGVEMFVEQAALQFQAWTGVRPDRSAVAEWVTSQL